jgi:two-component system, OmpR family, sensor histidine kinase KdpD
LRFFTAKSTPKRVQYFFSIGLVLAVVLLCYFFHLLIGYKVVALLLLMTVSILAMLLDIYPVLIAAVLSAILWNFLFIPPVFTFHIDQAEDVLLFFLYFFVALVNAVLTNKVRKAESKARDKEEKENTIKLYNTLLNSLSHELRTPIAAIIGSVDTLKENKDRLTVAQQLALLDEIDTASLRLNRQVENLLSMSRLETGMLKLNLDWCDVNEMIAATIQKLPHDEFRSIVLQENDQLPFFKIDRGLMEQVIYNLIHNAVQYTPKGTHIYISVVHEAEHCLITVADDGKGFPEEEMQHVFDKFYRLPNARTGGSGLGLSIVKGFVEAHHGTVQLSNNVLGGASFVIRLPAETSYLNNLKNE